MKVVVGLVWLTVVVSALGVVASTHAVRVQTHELEQLRHQAVDLHVESGRLLLEESSLGSYVRVQQLAQEKLGMIVPAIENVVIVTQ